AVDHQPSMQPTRLRRRAGSDKAPVVIETDQQKKPVEPGDVVGDEEHRPRRIQHRFVVGAETKQQTQEQTKENSHEQNEYFGFEITARCRQPLNPSQIMMATVTKTARGDSQRSIG